MRLLSQGMTHTPDILTLSTQSLEYFLGLLPAERVTRRPDQVTVHAECGDAIWICRNGRWMTAAPGFDRARRGWDHGEKPH